MGGVVDSGADPPKQSVVSTVAIPGSTFVAFFAFRSYTHQWHFLA